MDPDANYREQELIYLRIKAGTAHPGDHGRLKALVAALRGWVSNGGFKPRGYVGPAWKPAKQPARPSARRSGIYATTYCNKGHYIKSGRPVGHECVVIPPAALAAEMAGNYDDAIRIMSKGRR